VYDPSTANYPQCFNAGRISDDRTAKDADPGDKSRYKLGIRLDWRNIKFMYSAQIHVYPFIGIYIN
jgi:hypothetical protein